MAVVVFHATPVQKVDAYYSTVYDGKRYYIYSAL
jgi:hypothetical protein